MIHRDDEQATRAPGRAIVYSRRGILAAVGVLAGCAAAPVSVREAVRTLPEPVTPAPVPAVARAVPAAPRKIPGNIRPQLWDAALSALEKHKSRCIHDRIAIVDFAASSSTPRFHFVDLKDGNTVSYLVAHGSGSDPGHSGWLQYFSNVPGSNATSSGCYLTDSFYYGAHGRSQRLIGLDPSNYNAMERAIVIHGAWYAEADIVSRLGKLGRSQGCLAVGNSQINEVLDHFGHSRLIFATKMV